MLRTKKERTDVSPRQKRARLIFIAAILLILAVIWITRYPKGYVNMFLGHYVGTSSVLSSLDGLEHSQTELDAAAALEPDWDDWRESHLYETLTLSASADGTRLTGDFYNVGSSVTLIALHSFDGSRKGDFLYVPWYAQQGYNVFIPDIRSHGDNEEYMVTWGDYESRDVLDWMDLLDQKYGSQTYILHGQDLGASAALWCAGDARIAFITAESPVTELYPAARYLLKKQFGIPGFFMPLIDSSARSVLPDGRSMRDFSLESAVAGADTPILILNAEGGTMVDPDAVDAFYESYTGPKTIVRADTSHGMIYPAAQADVEAVLARYSAQYIKNQSAVSFGKVV